MKKNAKFAGFSLLESVVVIGVIMILSGLLLGYNRASNRQLALYSSQVKVVGFLNQAKAAALEKRAKEFENACAFGVRFVGSNAERLILFADRPNNQNDGCVQNNFNKAYDQNNSELMRELLLDSGVVVDAFFRTGVSQSAAFPVDVVFEPPYLKTYNSGTVRLKIQGQSIFACIKIGEGGAIFAANCP